MPGPNIVKGTRVRARWFQSKPLGTFSLAGVQMKTTGMFVDVIGVCRHFRGDDPVAPKEVRIYIEVQEISLTPEQEKEHALKRGRPFGCECPGHENLLEIHPDHIVALVPEEPVSPSEGK